MNSLRYAVGSDTKEPRYFSICDVRKRERNRNMDKAFHSHHLVEREDSGQV
jgi:hypothetical protein